MSAPLAITETPPDLDPFSSVISSKHGGCVIIPREDGYIRYVVRGLCKSLS